MMINDHSCVIKQNNHHIIAHDKNGKPLIMTMRLKTLLKLNNNIVLGHKAVFTCTFKNEMQEKQ